MLRDLRLRARVLALHVAAANARAELRARMHTTYDVAHNRLRDGSLRARMHTTYDVAHNRLRDGSRNLLKNIVKS